MKNNVFLLSFMTVFMLAACAGAHDPDDGSISDVTAPFTLSVDKPEIESDGKDAAIFTITDAQGRILTDAGHIRNTSFQIVETGEWRTDIGSGEAPNVFTSISDGTYTIKAMYEGEYCQNEVTVTSKNRSAYELFHKNVLIYRFTATWCQFCPSMTVALDKINDWSEDHSIVMEFHGNDQYTFDAISSYANEIYGTKGFPYCIYSLAQESGKRTVNDIQRAIKSVLVDYPAKTGIKGSASVQDGGVVVNATVKASAEGEYDLVMAVLKDDCKPSAPADGSTVYEDEYDDVIVGITGNFKNMSSERFSLGKNEEKQVRKEIAEFPVSDPGKYEVILYTLVKTEEGKTVVDNAVSIPLGESVDYRYN